MMAENNPADTVEFTVAGDLPPKHFGPRPLPVGVTFGAASHTGKVRANNEDHFLVVERRRSRAVLLTNLPEGFLTPADDVAYVFGVADGMGGEAFGELASRLALRSGWEQSPQAIKWGWILNDQEVQDLQEQIEIIFQKMDQTLLDRARQDPALTGMGTTLTAAYTVGPEALIAHVGDSRAYLHRQGRLLQLTRDHTLAQRCRDAGIPIAFKSWYHQLTNCLGGVRQAVEVEFHHFHLEDGDQLLLCTDGLTDLVHAETIARTLGRGNDPQALCDNLIAQALERGGTDNVTVVLARYEVKGAVPAGEVP